MDAAELGELVAVEIQKRVGIDPDGYGCAYVRLGSEITLDIAIGYQELGEIIQANIIKE